jgi:hypothetical protein
VTDSAPATRRPKFPTAFTVLAIVLAVVWIASFAIPSGVYETDPEAAAPRPGTYHELPSCAEATGDELCVDKSLRTQFGELWNSPPNGLYGIENAQGKVAGDEEGFLYGSAKIFLFVLAVGAFITVTMRTGAIQTGIGRLALRYRSSGGLLVVVLMLIFALGGTTYGMWEETPGFFPLLVPLVLALGYDRLVAVAMIFFGAGTGTLASTVNPFATGVASDAAGISVGDGIAVHRLDAARLYRLALEKAPAGSVFHAVADEGVPTREIAEVIGRHLNVPAISIAPGDAGEHFGWIGAFFALDAPASSTLTQERLGWQPTHPGLIADLEAGHYFTQAQPAAA